MGLSPFVLFSQISYEFNALTHLCLDEFEVSVGYYILWSELRTKSYTCYAGFEPGLKACGIG